MLCFVALLSGVLLDFWKRMKGTTMAITSVQKKKKKKKKKLLLRWPNDLIVESGRTAFIG